MADGGWLCVAGGGGDSTSTGTGDRDVYRQQASIPRIQAQAARGGAGRTHAVIG